MPYAQTPMQTIACVAAANIVAGRLVRLGNNANGALPLASPVTTAGVTRNVYVALPEPDGMPRPTDERELLAADYAVGDATVGTGWQTEPQTYTLYRVGLSNQWSPTIKAGMRMLAAKGGVVLVQPAAYVDSAGIKQEGALVRAANDGRFELTNDTNNDAIGVVVHVDADTNALSIHLF